jgi:hypothetical protein
MTHDQAAGGSGPHQLQAAFGACEPVQQIARGQHEGKCITIIDTIILHIHTNNAYTYDTLKGPKEKQWAGVEIPNKNIETRIDPYDYIYADYRSGEDSLYKKWENDTIFRGVDR